MDPCTEKQPEIQLTYRHKLRKARRHDTWQLFELAPEGGWLYRETHTGPRRGLLKFLERQGIEPNRAAEKALAALPELERGFREGSGIERN